MIENITPIEQIDRLDRAYLSEVVWDTIGWSLLGSESTHAYWFLWEELENSILEAIKSRSKTFYEQPMFIIKERAKRRIGAYSGVNKSFKDLLSMTGVDYVEWERIRGDA